MVIDKNKEAMKLALEALEPRPGMPNPEYESLTQCAITALKALAERPAQQHFDHTKASNAALRDAQNRSTSIARAIVKGINNVNIAERPAQPYKGIADHTNQVTNGRMRIDSVTGDLGIGTPSPQPAQQEPVKPAQWQKIECPICGDMAIATDIPAAQRTWVGLTLEEIDTEWGLFMSGQGSGYIPDFVHALEAKLKEKNNG